MHTVSPHSDLAMILALVKRMAGSPKEQDAYCEWLRLRTADLLGQLSIWDQVDAVTGALLERETLTGRQLRSVIQEWNLAHVEARRRPSGAK